MKLHAKSLGNRLLKLVALSLMVCCIGSLTTTAQDMEPDCVGKIQETPVILGGCIVVFVHAEDCNGNSCDGIMAACPDGAGGFTTVQSGSCFE